MQHVLETFINKTQFLDTIKLGHILIGLISNSALAIYLRMNVPQELTLWFTVISAGCLALLGIRKLVVQGLKDYTGFKKGDFLNDEEEYTKRREKLKK